MMNAGSFNLSIDVLLNATNGTLHQSVLAEPHLLDAVDTFSSVNIDSRTIKAGDLFVAIRGERFDGHDFIEQAVKQKACAVVVEYYIENCSLPQIVVSDTTIALGQISHCFRMQFAGTLVGITGSCGKTSVKGLLVAIFERCVTTLSTVGNFNNHIGVPLTLNRFLPSHELAVVEIGTSSPNEIEYLTRLVQPTIALVNNVRPAHIGGFGSIEAIAEEKGKIYSTLTSDQTAVINLDDPFAPQYLTLTQAVKQLGFSRHAYQIAQNSQPPIDCVYAEDCVLNTLGQPSFTLCFQAQRVAVSLNVLGEHFIDNALAAAACALAAGIELDKIAAGLQTYTGEKGRMQCVPSYDNEQQACLINDAYNANPASVQAAIDFLSSTAQQSAQQSVLVLGNLGELGDDEVQQHRLLGTYAKQQGIKHFLTIGHLAQHAADAFGSNAMTFNTLAEAVETLSALLDTQALILLKGSRSSGVDKLIDLVADARRERACSDLPVLKKGHSPC